MTEKKGVLFVPYQDTLGLLSVEDALAVCEEVYLMHARGSVVLSNPPSFKLDVADGFHNRSNEEDRRQSITNGNCGQQREKSYRRYRRAFQS